MAMVGQSSFRRILLLRILLLSIPILFLGMAVTFRKARSSLLQTAQENLEQSAARKAETINNSIKALQTSLAIASETAPLQFGSPVSAGNFLEQLKSQLPTAVQCLQLKDLETSQMVASTCGNQILDSVDTKNWPKQRQPADLNDLQTHTLTVNQINRPSPTDNTGQLNLLLSTPVYNTTGQLRYSLTAQTVIKQMESSAGSLLQGDTIVIDQNGRFLAHPVAGQVGLNISNPHTQAGDSTRLEEILTKIQRGETDSRYLFNLAGDQDEWIAGFSPLKVQVQSKHEETWALLAVTPANSALAGLDDITQILLILTVGLLAAHLLAMLYMARDLALPIEQLGKYALRIHKRDPLERAPKNFRIRELNHLAEVLDNMVGRLEERAKELESAWQEAEAANQLKSEFLANTSHELRTPLNAIIGCIRLVKDDCCDSREEEVEFLQQADKAAIHLLKIINDLLDIQRIEEKKLPLSIETIDLRQIIKDVVELETVPIQQKGLELSVNELPEPIIVRADSARLKQVLLNIIYNAIKFTDQGGITIQTRIENAQELQSRSATQNGHHAEPNGSLADEHWVIIAVQDTGIGIDPAQQHKLFRPFVMVDGSTTRKFEGTGLGLAISRNLVEMMGGQISLHSAGLGHGTTVKVALPVLNPPVDAANGQEPAKENPSAIEPSTIG